MNKRREPWAALLLAVALLLPLAGCQTAGETSSPAPATASLKVVDPATPTPATPTPEPSATATADPKGNTESLDENGSYDSVEDVALYIHTYGELPDNYMTKDEARDLGWNGGSVERYAPGMCIGGDRFSNREGQLPKANGRVWTECDVDTLGENSRGAKRIVFSNDGLIYYTDDHYENFQLLYDDR